MRSARSPRELVVDGSIALVLFVAVLVGYVLPRGRVTVDGRFVAGMTLLVVMHGVLVWRRRAPALVLAVVTAAFVFHATLDQPYVSPFAMIVAIYTVAAYTDPRTAAGAGALGWAAAVGGNWLQTRDNLSVPDMASIAVALAVTWVVGARIGRSRANLATFKSRAENLERERDELDRAAAAEERARIARELHDVVSHNLSVMVVQAGGARRIADGDPARAREALASIESTGRLALTEMRRLLGLISAEEPALAPAGGVDALGELVDRVRAAGLPIELEVTGERTELPPGVDVSVHRIVQEALTNVMKHAGEARARVRIRYERDAVEIGVTDDGRGGPNDDGGGRGLAGMRERVALFGGTFRAGPRGEGGYEVSVRLPLEDER
jgi:signal transduction histidine kinase